MGEPTSDLQSFTTDFSYLGEYLYITCDECKQVVDSWELPVQLHEVIAVAQEHKRADLEKGWVKTDG